MHYFTQYLKFGRTLLLLGCLSLISSMTASPITVIEPEAGTTRERLAAREVRRYLYLRTGSVPMLTKQLPVNGPSVQLLRANDPLVQRLLDPASLTEAKALRPEEYLLRTVNSVSGRRILIVGGDDTGLLYGAYRFCELIGVRFYLHGDVVPDRRLAGDLPAVNESGHPLFALRGLLPFHDFPEGPDWWTRDDYRAHLAQMAKLRMNFFALHCYPEDVPRANPEPHPEPLVWIGPPQDLNADGGVRASYPAFWAATSRDRYWGYDRMTTSEFSGGASQLFARDEQASEIFADLPIPSQTADQSNLVFDRAGALLGKTFAFARALGVKTSVGTETPLTIPQPVRQRLQKSGLDPSDPKVVQALYTGIFKRIQEQYPVDYYWLWTPESWTWSGNNEQQYAATVADIHSALSALESLKHPFTLATCGWVLGPGFDRTALDHVLPAEIPMSCINREVGHDFNERGFREVKGRPKWTIPWLENDQNLTSPQLWAGRMRYDAVDAKALGCTGLLGCHWRTKILAPNVAALASAAWDQSFAPPDWDLRARVDAGGLHAGRVITASEPVDGAEGDEAEVCRTMLEDAHDIYIMGVPNGRYRITLLFNETQATRTGTRVFDIAVQDDTLVQDLDIFAKAGRNHLLKLGLPEIPIGDSPLHLHFTPHAGEPSIAGFGIEGLTRERQDFSLWINLGGNSVGKFTNDYTRDKPPAAVRERAMPVADLYEDFARANFGEEAGAAAGRIFTQIDGYGLPQSSHWDVGPGGIKPLKIKPGTFDYIEKLAALRSTVKGAGNLDRLDYWLKTFRYQKALAEVGDLRADLDSAVHSMIGGSDSAARVVLAESALKIRLQLTRAWEEMMSQLVTCVDTPGELGTIANLEQHNRRRLRLLSLYDQDIAQALGRPLPADVEPGNHYSGPARLAVPTVRGEAEPGESLKVTILAIDQTRTKEVNLHWRSWGGGTFNSVRAKPVGRSVYEANLPTGYEELEYYITAQASDGTDLRWPATAPEICQTVITLPQDRAK